MQSGTTWIWRNQSRTVAQGELVSQAYSMDVLMGGQIFAVFAGGGTGKLTVDVTPVEKNDDQDSADTILWSTLSTEEEVFPAGTAGAADWHTLPTEMQKPFGQVRFNFTPAGATATGVWVGVCHNVVSDD